MVVAPGEELADGSGVGGAGILVADVGGEEFEEASGGVVAEVGDEARDDDTGRDGLADEMSTVRSDREFVRNITVNENRFLIRYEPRKPGRVKC